MMTDVKRSFSLLFLSLTIFGCGIKVSNPQLQLDPSPQPPNLHYYADACPSRLYPVGRNCGPSGTTIPDPQYPTCASLGIKEGDLCNQSGNKCVSIPSCTGGFFPSTTLEANYYTCVA